MIFICLGPGPRDLALPPLYRLTQGTNTVYARDDAHKDELMVTAMTGRAKVEISRFKGLGEMPPAQLRDTTMAHETRQLLRVRVPAKSANAIPEDVEERRHLDETVETLMGRKPELRFAYIQENAKFVEDLDV